MDGINHLPIVPGLHWPGASADRCGPLGQFKLSSGTQAFNSPQNTLRMLSTNVPRDSMFNVQLK